jgi:hypothetical protein
MIPLLALHNSYTSQQEKPRPNQLDLSPHVPQHKLLPADSIPKRKLFDLVPHSNGTFVQKQPISNPIPIPRRPTDVASEPLPPSHGNESTEQTYVPLSQQESPFSRKPSLYALPAHASSSCPSFDPRTDKRTAIAAAVYATPQKSSDSKQSESDEDDHYIEVTPLYHNLAPAHYSQPRPSAPPLDYATPSAPPAYNPHPHSSYTPLIYPDDALQAMEAPQEKPTHRRQRSASFPPMQFTTDPLLNFVQQKEESIHDQLQRLRQELENIKRKQEEIAAQPYNDSTTPLKQRGLLKKLFSTKAKEHSKSLDEQDAERQKEIQRLQQERTKIAGKIGAIQQRLVENPSSKS